MYEIPPAMNTAQMAFARLLCVVPRLPGCELALVRKSCPWPEGEDTATHYLFLRVNDDASLKTIMKILMQCMLFALHTVVTLSRSFPYVL